ncbi:hypothetical protein A2U01_0095229, partial [Trifolium medium]|nr:hypothetical protein [Trifolium medium]
MQYSGFDPRPAPLRTNTNPAVAAAKANCAAPSLPDAASNRSAPQRSCRYRARLTTLVISQIALTPSPK